jgi:GNAT superfamily N-acetyltransferase
MNNTDIYIEKYLGSDLIKKDVRKMIDVIYKNFEEIADVQKLKHTSNEIYRLLVSSMSVSFFGISNKKIIAYIIAELNEVNGKRLLHINYLYVVPSYRNKGCATKLLNIIYNCGKEYRADILSLTFDTFNKKLERFYLDNYFNYDPKYRSNQRYDMLIKKII